MWLSVKCRCIACLIVHFHWQYMSSYNDHSCNQTVITRQTNEFFLTNISNI
uniref:Uncharacterized protein n=1 Tax=Octopus bimaculoides TaxID=37653 RepID=A0A0L8IGN6_OCTBM